MSLSPTEAQQLDALATRALDALRDQDRLAVQAATAIHGSKDAHARAQEAARRAQDAELALFDAIHALVRHTPRSRPQAPRESTWYADAPGPLGRGLRRTWLRRT